jgi:hypothetical protein
VDTLEIEIKFIGGHPGDRDKIFLIHTVKLHQISEVKSFYSGMVWRGGGGKACGTISK